MSWLNHTSSSVPENPSQLIVQRDKVTYKGYAAPTLKAQYAKVTKAHGQELTKWWDDIYDLSTAYYNDMPLQDLLANWNRKNGIVDSFFSLISSGRDKNILKNKLYHLIWDKNPLLGERYDGVRLIADGAIPWYDENEKQVMVYNYGPNEDQFQLTVKHLDSNGELINDHYTLSLDGTVEYKNSLIQGGRKLSVPPKVYDPGHPGSLQVSVREDVVWLLEKL